MRPWGQAWELFRAQMADKYRRVRYSFDPPCWMGPASQTTPTTFLRCVWCEDELSLFWQPTVDLGDGWAHKECVDKAERFALKASIRNRTNPATGYFSGWRTP